MLRAILGAPETGGQKISVCSFSTATVTATCSGGSVAVTTPDDRGPTGKPITSTLVTITGLAPWQTYSYTVSQEGESISGTFRTAPGDQNTDFSFVISTCDWNQNINTFDPYSSLRKIMGKHPEPMICQFHIDDVLYADAVQVNDADTGIVSTGKPQDTLEPSDYAIAWAAYFGMFQSSTPEYSKWSSEDRQWIYRNLPRCVSGGDHAVGDNHCRGDVQASTGYIGCDRTPGTGREAVAKAEWDTFFGRINPDPLTAGKWHWGLELGPLRLALFDYSLYSQPFDSNVNDPNLVGYGAEQITAIMNYMDVASVPFKCFFHESHPYMGQGWQRWHPNEADGWKTDFDASANLNGTSGNSFACAGDNHAIYATEFDTFWMFGPGLLNSILSVDFSMDAEGQIAALAGTWGGKTKFKIEGYQSGTNGDHIYGGWWHFRVLASQSPKKIEARCYSAIDGSLLSPVYTLVEGAANNQWTKAARKIG